MIAKIGKGGNLYGAISYNQLKVDRGLGKVLGLNKIPETINNTYNTNLLYHSFIPYLAANVKTEVPVRHISLNPDPDDKLTDVQYIQIAEEYMDKMGYGNQPYIIYKHTDIDRTHLHIVSVCIDETGRKISDSYDHPRSMKICRDLEKRYGLIPADEEKRSNNEVLFKPVDYQVGDIKSQIASVVRHLPNYYQYQTLGGYNALLSLFNITIEKVKGEINGQPREGLVYFALNENGEKVSNPIKASKFGKVAGINSLKERFLKAKEALKNHHVKAVLKNTIESVLSISKNESQFKSQLIEQGINTVIRRSEEGRIYGITFIDHESRTVWNGSALDKNLSANVFNDWWKEQTAEQRQNTEQKRTITLSAEEINVEDEKEETHRLFDFLDKEQPNDDTGLIDGLGWLLPEAQGEDYEEQAFANRMKKKHKRKRNQ
ncbi:conjugal transfer protein MobB [Chryseobacterium defluvii]|uniref:Relaxase/mobilization nuclease-like protein n=1 Tax=Chryseobacterium defluvii TaxID=160396 RepID=A0A495SQY9_9FLAO|nr:conjugal transfer protein MobB [Chryseobacterium defluvii]RKT01800.1 relaxase/mobilization nuclease-like protein [Chryseobacterium defluvii]